MKINYLFLKFKLLITNEQSCIEILPFNFNILFFFLEIINYQQNIFLKKKFSINFCEFFVLFKKIEIDRLKFLFKIYYRIRLRKIDKYYSMGRKGKKFFRCLSVIEKKYARAYNYFFYKIFGKSIENFWPTKILKQLKVRKIFLKKNTADYNNFYIFFRVIIKKKNFSSAHVSKDIFDDFNFTSINCIKYKFIKKLLLSESIFLV
jgi:hypothetical protein